MKNKILLLNAKWVLTNTVRNFISLTSRTCKQQWQNIAHPLKPAIAKGTPQELLKQLQARWDKKKLDLSPYVLLSAKQGRLDCLKVLLEFAETSGNHISVLDALNESVIQYHNDCAEYLLNHIEGKWQYQPFDIALKINNRDFVHIYLNTLDSSSSRWSAVLNMMEKNKSLPLLCTSQAHRLEQIVPHLDEQQRAVCQDFLSQQQHQRIAQHVNVVSDQPKKKKM